VVEAIVPVELIAGVEMSTADLAVEFVRVRHMAPLMRLTDRVPHQARPRAHELARAVVVLGRQKSPRFR
jgi:hypothetical protein